MSAIILRIQRVIPWRYGRFLRFAADCLILRRVDTAYEFTHLLLRDFFAGEELAQGIEANASQTMSDDPAPRQLKVGPV